MEQWDKLRFLVGEWSSPTSGEPGAPLVGLSTFSFQLDENIVIRNSHTEFSPAAGEAKGLVHDDLLIIYPQAEAGEMRAIYFDNEGHTINYQVSSSDKPLSVIFDSEATNFSPRARLVYSQIADGRLEVEFFVAFSGNELKSHVKGSLERKI